MRSHVAARLAEVTDRNRHFGTCDVVRAALEIHAHAPVVVYEGFRQAHLQPLGRGPLAVLAAHVDLAEVRVVEAGFQQVETVSVSVAGVVEWLFVAQGSAVQPV